MKKYKVFDAHADTLFKLAGDSSESLFVKREELFSFGGYVQVFACFVPDGESEPLRSALRQAEIYNALKEAWGISGITEGYEITNVLEEGLVGGILALENGLALENRVESIDVLHKSGFRMMSLTWNGANELGAGAYAEGGLSDFGKKTVRRINEIQMALDLAHLSERSFWDAVELTEKPLIVSHTGVGALRAHRRNLSDKQIRAVIESGGVIGISLYPEFLSTDGYADISSVIRHVEHVFSLGGEDSVGLGTDFDGIDKCAEGLGSVKDLRRLFDEMKRLGYTASQVEKFACLNFSRVLSGILS